MNLYHIVFFLLITFHFNAKCQINVLKQNNVEISFSKNNFEDLESVTWLKITEKSTINDSLISSLSKCINLKKVELEKLDSYTVNKLFTTFSSLELLRSITLKEINLNFNPTSLREINSIINLTLISVNIKSIIKDEESEKIKLIELFVDQCESSYLNEFLSYFDENSIEFFCINNVKFEKISKFLRGSRMLNSLVLNDVKTSTLPFKIIKQNKKLEYLELHNNPSLSFKKKDIKILAKSNVKILSLFGTPLSESHKLKLTKEKYNIKLKLFE